MLLSLKTFVALAAVMARVGALPRVTRVGRYLYQEDGTRFYMRGIAYQEQGERGTSEDNTFGEPETFVDPLALPEACQRDAERFRDANINMIRVYSVDDSLDHDACMQAFEDAGIYAFIDLPKPAGGSITRTDSAWTTDLQDLYLKTIDAFSKYTNIVGYTVANEVFNGTLATYGSFPFVKAAARDTKAYLRSIGHEVLVGYAAIDGAERLNQAEYLSCGSEDTSIDVFGLNVYSWCGESTVEDAYGPLLTEFDGYNVASYFSEYGCVSAGPREWSEVEALYGEEMNQWSGGAAFAYFPTTAVDGEFGMTTVDGDTVDVTGEFTSLSTAYNAVTTLDSPSQDSVAASTYPTCPTIDGASNILPGTPNADECNCLFQALSCHVTDSAAATSDLGALLGTACGLLGEEGESCDEITGSGATGVYGRVAACSPRVKLSYAMSQYYESQNKDPRACDFSGAGQVNSGSTSDAADAASTCIPDPSAATIPAISSEPGTGNGGNGNGNGNGGSTRPGTNPDSGAVALGPLSSLLAAAGAVVGAWALN